MTMTMTMIPMQERPSMKRRRPWTTMSSVVVTAAAVVLSSGILAAAVALAEPVPRIRIRVPNHLDFRRLQSNTEFPIEQDVTSSPSLAPTKSDSTQAPSGPLIKRTFPVQFEIVLQVTDSVAFNDLLRDMANILEQYIFANLQDLEEENPALSIKGISLSVTVVARRRRRRSLQITRTVTLDVKGGIQLEIRPTADNGATDVVANVSTEAQALLTAPSLKQAIADANIENVIAVVDENENTMDPNIALQVDQEEPTEPPSEINPTTEALNDTTDDDNNNGPSLLSIIFGFVLVAIATAGLVAYGYIFYRKRQKKLAKRRKMRESVQYQPPKGHKSTATATATTTSPGGRSVAPTMRPTPTLALPPPIGKISNDDDNDDENDSEGSSYKGIGSASEEDVAGKDEFARELQTAASLDEQAWEDFQQQKQRVKQRGRAVSHNNSAEEQPYSPAHSGSVAMYSAQTSDSLPDVMPNDPEESPRFAKSFPYGDEQDEEDGVAAQGVEWTTEGIIDTEGDSWEPYSSKVTMGTDRPKTSSASSLAAIQAIERSMGRYGSENVGSTNDDDALATSDAVQEVERLSRFVQRYEKKKERRIAREQERRSRSSVSGSVDYDELSGAGRSFMGRSIDSAQGADNVSYLNTTYSESPRGMDSYSEYGSLRDEKKIDTSAPSLLHEDPSDMPSMDETEVTDFTTELHTMSEGNDITQRLGITPFRVQKPVEIESDDDDDDDDDEEPISAMMQKLAQAEAVRNARTAPQDGDSLPTDERGGDRRSQPQALNEQQLSRHQQLQMHQDDRRRAAQQQDGRRNSGPPQQNKSLTSLRGNSAIIDKKPSKSLASLRNTNKAFLDNQSDANFSPMDEERRQKSEVAPPSPPPRELPAPTNPPRRRSGKFDNLRNLFETPEKAPIYPPDQHWQYTGKLSNGRSKSFGN